MARVLLGVTGSVAAVKTPPLYYALQEAGHVVKVAVTGPALAFFAPADLHGDGDGELPVRGQSVMYLDADEWPEERLFHVGEPVLHVELRNWAEVLLLAPLDANTLAKGALGLCDNLLTCVYRAWDRRRGLVLAPAMNTLMWEHPATARHLRQIAEDYTGAALETAPEVDTLISAINGFGRIRVVAPQSKRLACGDVGVGGLAELDQIVRAVGVAAAEVEPFR
jgi:phosphopantothenoylcysteine decarboxylase